MIVYLNGKFVDEGKAMVSVLDHGFLYGDGVYETLRVYNGRIFKLKEHLVRLQTSARGLSIKLPLSLVDTARVIKKVVTKNRHKEAVLRVILTRGKGDFGFDIRSCLKSTLFVSSRPFHAYPEWYYKQGVRLAAVSVRRNNPLALPPWIKSMNCLNGILAKRESIEMGAQEGLFLSTENLVLEGTVTNIFCAKNEVIWTPGFEHNFLVGITRDMICRLARKNGFKVIEKRIPFKTFLKADEFFLTNTTFEVLPVTELVWKKGGVHHLKRPMGPITQAMRWLFSREIAKFRNGNMSAV